MNFIKKLASFEDLISTSLIKVLYWLGIIGIALTTLLNMFKGFSSGFGAGLGDMITALVFAGFSVLIWRVLCEIFLVVFGILDRLGNIQKSVGNEPVKDIKSVSDSDA